MSLSSIWKWYQFFKFFQKNLGLKREDIIRPRINRCFLHARHFLKIYYICKIQSYPGCVRALHSVPEIGSRVNINHHHHSNNNHHHHHKISGVSGTVFFCLSSTCSWRNSDQFLLLPQTVLTNPICTYNYYSSHLPWYFQTNLAGSISHHI